MTNAISIVPTTQGSRYLQQLCKHWAHNLAVDYTPTQGKVIFPPKGRAGDWPGEATLLLQAADDHLSCQLLTSAPEQLEALKGVVESHLDRFAFREAPLTFDWREPA